MIRRLLVEIEVGDAAPHECGKCRFFTSVLDHGGDELCGLTALKTQMWQSVRRGRLQACIEAEEAACKEESP